MTEPNHSPIVTDDFIVEAGTMQYGDASESSVSHALRVTRLSDGAKRFHGWIVASARDSRMARARSARVLESAAETLWESGRPSSSGGYCGDTFEPLSPLDAGTLGTQALSAQEKLDALWVALEAEAERRGWCTEYDDFAAANGGPGRKVRTHVTVGFNILFEHPVGTSAEVAWDALSTRERRQIIERTFREFTSLEAASANATVNRFARIPLAPAFDSF